MSDVYFEEAPEVKEIAEQLIDRHHPHLQDAKDVIGYRFRCGQSDWAGKAKKLTAFERFETGYMLMVFINKEAWTVLSEPQQVALVDHELCHFSRKSERVYEKDTDEWVDKWLPKEDPSNWVMREHDVEEFSDVIKRHGLWETGIEKFASVVRNADHQMDLDDLEREQKGLRVVK
jgi:hypothetical protein